jgi:hypothetical protein
MGSLSKYIEFARSQIKDSDIFIASVHKTDMYNRYGMSDGGEISVSRGNSISDGVDHIVMRIKAPGQEAFNVLVSKPYLLDWGMLQAATDLYNNYIRPLRGKKSEKE